MVVGIFLDCHSILHPFRLQSAASETPQFTTDPLPKPARSPWQGP